MTPPTRQTTALLGALSGEGAVWSADFLPGARAWAGIHGGAVVGTMLQAAELATGATAVAVTAHLHAPVRPGTTRLDIAIQRAGRAVISAQTTLHQEDRRATAQVLLSPDAAGAEDLRTWPRTLPPAAELRQDPVVIPRLDLPTDVMPFAKHVDIRPLGDHLPLAGGSLPELRAWIRLTEPHPYSPALAALLLDALFPSLYAVQTEPVPIPTAEITAHFAPTEAAPDWFYIQQRTVWATPGLCLDDAELWTAEGRLLAQARQLRRILRQPAGPAASLHEQPVLHRLRPGLSDPVGRGADEQVLHGSRYRPA
ncbi:MAG: TesB-like acyl-CoA thioesterase 1 [Frankiales bacterium]|nr:TesB-like acyl-CoA thioesterase 1 [Frankiales bacterium]